MEEQHLVTALVVGALVLGYIAAGGLDFVQRAIGMEDRVDLPGIPAQAVRPMVTGFRHPAVGMIDAGHFKAIGHVGAVFGIDEAGPGLADEVGNRRLQLGIDGVVDEGDHSFGGETHHHVDLGIDQTAVAALAFGKRVQRPPLLGDVEDEGIVEKPAVDHHRSREDLDVAQLARRQPMPDLETGAFGMTDARDRRPHRLPIAGVDLEDGHRL